LRDSQSPKVKAKAFTFGLLKFASLTRTGVNQEKDGSKSRLFLWFLGYV
jgi:hypothetical protein